LYDSLGDVGRIPSDLHDDMADCEEPDDAG